MLAELPLSSLASLAGRFTTPPAQLAVASISAGNTAGRLWAEADAPAAGALLLWDQGNNILYTGVPSEPAGALSSVVHGEIRAAAGAAGLERFGVRALDGASEPRIPELFDTLLWGQRRSMFWEWPAGREPAAGKVAPDGIGWQPIDRVLLARDDIEGLDEVRHEIGWMWPSLEHYYARGLGSAALLDHALVCWCTAEYVGPRRCGIGIATAEQYRGRGLATATAAHFVSQALGRGLVPCWECSADNAASARVAARVGFELCEEHTTWLGSFQTKESANGRE